VEHVSHFREYMLCRRLLVQRVLQLGLQTVVCIFITRMKNRKQKRGGRKLNLWKEEDMRAAVKEVKDGQLKLRVAARAYNLPLGSLQRRVKGTVANTGHCSGRKAVLSARDEQALANHCLLLARRGFPLKRQQLRSLALQFCKQRGCGSLVKTAEETGMLGQHWLDGFLRRNPSVAIRKAESLSQARAIGLNAAVVDGWFNELGNFLQSKGVLNRGHKIWNFDETGIQLTFKPGAVVAGKGAKVVSSITPSEKGETVTVAACAGGLGKYIPPMVLFKGKRMSAAMTDSLTSAPEGSLIALTESGYITSEMMVRWGEHFCKYKPQGDPEVPDVLLLDGHSTHVFNVDFLNIMSRNNIEVFALPPHTTHELQPLDKSVFKSLKNKWDELAQKAFRLDRHNVSRSNFLKLFKECWDAIATVSNAQAGFRACGIVPFDRSVIRTEAFQPSLATDRPCPPSSNTESVEAPAPVAAATVPEHVESSGSQVSADVNVGNSEILSTNSQSVVALPPAETAQSSSEAAVAEDRHSPVQSTVDLESASVVYAKSNPPASRPIPRPIESALSPSSKIDTPTKILQEISPIPKTDRSSKTRKKY